MVAITIKDVAKLAGVSASTVSRVLSKDPRISDHTCKKVIECVNKLDYKVNTIARSLKTSHSYTIGFISPEIPNDFFMTVAKGVEEELSRSGYTLIICDSNESAREEAERIDLLYEKCVDGIIIIPATGQGKHFSMLEELNIPVVLVDRMVEGFKTDAVLVDNINGSYEATEYLIRNGHNRIGFIGGDPGLTSARERYDGYIRALEDYHIAEEKNIIKFGNFHVESGYRLIKELTELDDPPGVVFISNYFMHVGATKFLIDNAENLKNNLRFASFDDMELSAILGYSIVTVAQPMIEMGKRAARMLLDRINGINKGIPKVERLKTSLRTRG